MLKPDPKVVKTIDLTPSWESISALLVKLAIDGNDEGRRFAIEEIRRMAQAADGHHDLRKAGLNPRPALMLHLARNVR